MRKKVCMNTRDVFFVIDLGQLAFVQANGNYTTFYYIEGQKQMVTFGLSEVERCIRQSWPAEEKSPFIRMGRSLLINQSYLCAINTLKQQLILSDYKKHSYALTVPKQLLRQYKEEMYRILSTTRQQ